jgi:ATP-dependent DNA ligase
MNQGIFARRGRGLALWCPRPDWIEPMRTSPAEPRPLTADWVWEPRLDGVRCLAWTSEGGIALRDAGGGALDGRYPGLVALLAEACRGESILDGIITNQGLELFDCLFYEGATLTSLPLLDRRAVLRDAVIYGDGVHLVPYGTAAAGSTGHDGVLRAGAGIVAKRSNGRYVGGRSGDWLAFDCANAQEFVIGGYSESSDCGAALALLIGYYEEGRLRYAGRVSAAYDPSSLTAMAPTLARLRRRTSPFGGAVPGGGQIQWVSPALVAQIGFSEWTPAGLPRQPRFIGLRHDREPDEVRRTAARG